MVTMPIISNSQYWPSMGISSHSKVANYCREQTEVLSRQKIVLLVLPHKRTNVNYTNAKPL